MTIGHLLNLDNLFKDCDSNLIALDKAVNEILAEVPSQESEIQIMLKAISDYIEEAGSNLFKAQIDWRELRRLFYSFEVNLSQKEE